MVTNGLELGYGFALLLVLTALVSATFAVFAWRKRAEPGGKPLTVYNLVIAVAMVAYAFDILSTTRATQIFLVSIWFPAQALTATTWLYVAIEYAGLERWAGRRTVALLWLEPVVLAALVAVPSTRSLLFEPPATGVEGSLFFAGAASGPLLPVHFAFLYVLMLGGTFLFVRLFTRSKHLYRVETVSVVVAAVAPWTVILVQAIGVAPVEDPSAIAFAVSGMALTVGLYRFKNLDPVPAAREAVVATMGDGVVVLDTDGVVSSVNPAARRLLGKEADESALVGVEIDHLFPAWSRLDGKVVADAGPTDWHELSLSVDGSERVLEVQRAPFTDRFDRLVGTLVVLRDVTERKRREQRLAQYKTIFDSVTEPVYVLDDEDRFIRYNEPFAELVGHDELALVGEPMSTVLGDEPLTADGGQTQVRETTIRTASGTEVPCELDIAPVELADGTQGRVGIIRDISRRKRIESELAATTERLETLVEASPLAIISHDTDGVVNVWNPAAESLFGWNSEEVYREPLPIIPEENREELLERHERVQSGEHLTGWETELLCKDGSHVPARISAAPVRNVGGEIVGTVAIIADITEQKARQRRLERQNERLDEFASLVSHDLRNPLQVATGKLHLAKEGAGDVTGHIEDAEEALDRMERLIEDTLTLARRGRAIGATEQVPLATVAEQAWGNVQTDNGRLTLDDPPTVECDPDRVVELLENLFRNALTHGASGDEAVTVTVGSFGDGFYVEDDGTGIAPEDVEQVFDSGFTTDEEGTGLGLDIVETIAEAHGWTVTATESESGGARFEFS